MLLARAARAPAGELAQACSTTAARSRRGELADDCAVVVVKRTLIELRRPRGRSSRASATAAPPRSLPRTRSRRSSLRSSSAATCSSSTCSTSSTGRSWSRSDLREVSHGAARGACAGAVSQTSAGCAGLPTLDEALAFFAEQLPGIGLQVDLKRRGIEAGVVEALRRHGVLDRSWVSTFDARSLRRIAALEPELPRVLHAPARPLRDLEARPARAGRAPGPGVDRRVAAAPPAGAPRRAQAQARDAAPLGRLPGRDRARARARRGGLRLDGRRPAAGRRGSSTAGADGIITNDPRIFREFQGVKRLSLLLVDRGRPARVAGAVCVPALTSPPTEPRRRSPEGVTIGGRRGRRAALRTTRDRRRAAGVRDAARARGRNDTAFSSRPTCSARRRSSTRRSSGRSPPQPNTAVPLGVGDRPGTPAAFVATLAQALRPGGGRLEALPPSPAPVDLEGDAPAGSSCSVSRARHHDRRLRSGVRDAIVASARRCLSRRSRARTSAP